MVFGGNSLVSSISDSLNLELCAREPRGAQWRQRRLSGAAKGDVRTPFVRTRLSGPLAPRHQNCSPWGPQVSAPYGQSSVSTRVFEDNDLPPLVLRLRVHHGPRY